MELWQLITNFDAHLPELVAMHAGLVYLLVFTVVFLQIGVLPLFFLPGNPFLFVCGAVWAASQLNIVLLLLTLLLATLLGHLCAYWLGKHIGQVMFLRYLKWPDQAALDKTRAFYDLHGEKGFLFSLFLPVIRTLAPFLAGVTNMHRVKFVRSASMGAVIWVLTCVLTGYFFGNIPAVNQHLLLVSLLGLALVVLAVLLKKGWRLIAKSK